MDFASARNRTVTTLAFAGLGLAPWGCTSESAATNEVTTVVATATVVIDTPKTGAVVLGPTVTVTGQAYGATSVVVDGQPVEVHLGRFETVVKRPDGPTGVEAHAEGGPSTQVTFDVDALPPTLAVSAPSRALQQIGLAPVAIAATTADERGVTSVVVGGVTLTPNELGAVAGSVPVTEGLNLVPVVATDAAGHTTTETTAILAGEFAVPNEPIDDAAAVHIGPTAFDIIARAAAETVDKLDLDAFATAKNPFVDSATTRIDVTHVALGAPTEVALGIADGTLSVSAAVNKVELNATATLTLAGSPSTFTLAVTVERLAAAVPLLISTTDGQFVIDFATPVFDVQNLKVIVTAEDGTPVPDTGFVQGEILDTIETFVESLVTKYGRTPLQKTVDALTNPIPVPFLGTVVTVDLSAIGANVDADGLELRLSGSVFTAGDAIAQGDPGVFRTRGGNPLTMVSDDVSIALSDDLVNTVLHEAWARGWLAYTVDQSTLDGAKAEVDLVVGFLGSLVDILQTPLDPEAPLSVDLGAGLPPILGRDAATGLLSIGLGDATLGFRSGSTNIATGSVSLVLGLGAASDGEKVALQLGVLRSAFDLSALDSETKRRAESDIEPFVGTLLGEIGSLLSSLLVPFELPVFAGFQPIDLSLDDDGTGGAYLVIHSSIRALPPQ